MTGTECLKHDGSKWELQQTHSLLDAALALLILIPGIVCFVLLTMFAGSKEIWRDSIAALILITFLIFIGGACCSSGLWFMFGKCGSKIDKAESRVVSWWSLLFLYKERSCDLRSFNKVESVAHFGKGPPAYKVLLTDTTTWKSVRVVRECDQRIANRLASELAVFVGLPCESG